MKKKQKGGPAMAKGNKYSLNDPENFPEWYWTAGLHDACITTVETFEFPFDYSEFSRNKGKYDRNLLTLKIDAKGAIGDTSVKEIRLHNYKILTADVSLENRKKIWWLTDRLSDDGEHYVLEIDLQDFDSSPEEFTVTIKFDRAEVDRK